MFPNVGIHRNTDEYRRLLKEVREHRLAGLIFVVPPSDVAGSPLLGNPDIPHAIIRTARQPGMSAVTPDLQSFIDRSLTYLHGQGRRKAAVVTAVVAHGPSPYETDEWKRDLRNRGM